MRRFLDRFDLAIIMMHPVWVVIGSDRVYQNQRYQCTRHSEKHCQNGLGHCGGAKIANAQ